MTKRGYFIINGVPRVIINQVIRKPGVYFQESKDKIIKSNKIDFDRNLYVDLISQRGNWLRLEMDKRQKIWAKMKNSPKIPVLLLLQTIGINRKTITQIILNNSKFSQSFFEIQNTKFIKVLFDLKKLKIKNKKTVLKTKKKLIINKFLNPRSYYLGEIGRQQLNQKLGISIPNNQKTLTPYDILFIVDILIQVLKNKKNFDDIDHLQNRRIRTSGELIQNQLSVGLLRLEKRVNEKIKKEKGFLKFQNIFTPRALNSVFKEFFGSNPLSQFLDQANPLSELTHKRRLTSVGPGGVSRDNAGMDIRGIHPTHYGRICPIETPEGQNAGLVNSLTTFSRIDLSGSLLTPFFIIYKGQVQKQLGIQNLDAAISDKYPIILNLPKTSILNFLPNLPLTAQIDQNFKKTYRKNIKYGIVSCLQLISIATSLIPFLEHDDGNRALMGSNMQRQAVPLLHPESPIVGTGFENRVLFHSGNFIQSKESGLILYSSHVQIIIFSNFKKNLNTNNFNIYEKNLNLNQIKHNSVLFRKINFTFLKLQKVLLSVFFKHKERTIIDQNLFRKKNYLKKIYKIKKIKLNRYIFLLNYPKCLFFKKEFFKFLIYKTKLLYPKNFTSLNRKLDRFNLKKNQFLILMKSFYILRTSSVKKVELIINQIQLINDNPLFLCNSWFFNFEKYRFLKKNIYNLKYNIVNNSKLENKIVLNDYFRSNQGTCLVQKPFIKSGNWIKKGCLLTNNLSSHMGELSLGKNVLVGYLPWEGYNFEDAILISENLIYKDIFTSLHIEKYKIEVRNTIFGPDQITKKVPNLDEKSQLQLDARGVIKMGSWVEEDNILVGRITPIQKRKLFPHEKLLYDIIGKDLSSYRDTSLRVPTGVEGRIINIQVYEDKPSLKNQEQSKIESVIVYILESKKIKIGDKIAGRHGNKGIVSKILAIEDMPYYPDGTCLDMILNPLGVPSRMNIGQLFESLLGLIGKKLIKKFKILPFDEVYGYEASRSLVFFKLYETSLKLNQSWFFSPNFPGKFKLFDGRNGTTFTYPIMSGFSYMMKLIHLVDEKIHARSTGSYSLVTQQPLKGRSKHGGQRFGEMEVWALEGFGVAYTLQELLTVKSDDIKGRSQIMETILKNSDFYFGTPESFKVLIRELQSLCLDIQVYDKNIKDYMEI